MKKAFNSMLALTIGAAAMGLTSCSEDEVSGGKPTQQEIASKIVGKWKLANKEGQEYLTNNKFVLTFDGQQQCTSSFSREVQPFGGYFWINKYPNAYRVEGNTLSLSSDGKAGYKTMDIAVDAISNDAFTTSGQVVTQMDGTVVNEKSSHTYRRVNADYSRDILGVWEGVSMTGDETYGSAEARIAYYDDATYTYYRKLADVWYPSNDEACEYNVDGDWLATRWMPEGAETYNYEWWDIDAIKDGTMQWSALREHMDGSRYNTTFTWKKVDDFLTPEQIMAKLPGTWEYNHLTQTTFIKGEAVSTASKDLKPNETYTFTADGKHIDNSYSPADHSLQYTMCNSYTVKGNVITSITENFIMDGVEDDSFNGMKSVMVVQSISDDYLTFLNLMQLDEVDEEIGGDALLMVIRLKRVQP